jgi:hypothetical protein
MTKPERTRLKGAFSRCKWCNGYGCIGCDDERRKYEERQTKPIFTADRSDPKDMEALKRVFGLEALQHAFGPDGGGIAEIERGAALESLLQALRKQCSRPVNAVKEQAND